MLTGGEVSDYTQALALLQGMQAKAVLADQGYDADSVLQAAHAMIVLLTDWWTGAPNLAPRSRQGVNVLARPLFAETLYLPK